MTINVLANWENLNGEIMKFVEEEKYKNKVGIYVITNLVNNKKYIGQTLDSFKKRYLNHFWKLKNNKHDNIFLQKDFNTYGLNNFEFSVIKIINDTSYIDDAERNYIKKYGIENLYNIQYGGSDHTALGVKRSFETRKKISKANKIAMLGKKATPETKLKMSKARQGVTQWGKCKISYESAYMIKTMLINGYTPTDVSKLLDIEYKIVNNIYSSNTYKSVIVEGWNEFYKRTRKSKALSKIDIEKIKDLISKKYSISEISRTTGFSRETIRKYK